jgi:hypothetical protein
MENPAGESRAGGTWDCRRNWLEVFDFDAFCLPLRLVGLNLVRDKAYSQTPGGRGCGSPSHTSRALAPSQSNRFVNKPGSVLGAARPTWIRSVSVFKNSSNPFSMQSVWNCQKSPGPLIEDPERLPMRSICVLNCEFIEKQRSSEAIWLNLKQLTEPQPSAVSSPLQDREKP